jgi:hypothetical protein
VHVEEEAAEPLPLSSGLLVFSTRSSGGVAVRRLAIAAAVLTVALLVPAPSASAVDDINTGWFRRRVTIGGVMAHARVAEKDDEAAATGLRLIQALKQLGALSLASDQFDAAVVRRLIGDTYRRDRC